MPLVGIPNSQPVREPPVIPWNDRSVTGVLRRMRRRISAAFVIMVALLSVSTVSAAAPELSWSTATGLLSSTYWQGQIEQQSSDWFNYRNCTISGTDTCVYRPPNSPCIWNLDDGLNTSSNNGRLKPNASASGSLCMYTDGGGTVLTGSGEAYHRVEALVQSPSPNLLVTVSGSTGATYTLPEIANDGRYPYVPAGGYLWILCTRDTTPGPYPIVQQSFNNGFGTLVTYTIDITSTDAKRIISSIWGTMQAGWMTQYGPTQSSYVPPICT